MSTQPRFFSPALAPENTIYRPIKTTQVPRNTTQEATPLARDIKRKVLQLAQEGQFAKAVKNLTSAGLRNLDHDTMEELRSKHPQEPPQVPILGSVGEPNGTSKTLPATPPPVFDYADVLKAIRSFPKGTAAGASGFRAQHLVDAYVDPSKQDREPVLVPMAEVCTLLAAGKAPANAAPWIASAPIFPLKKKQGGIRPIAVGEVFRRLVSKLVLSSEGMQERIDKCLREVGQFGVREPTPLFKPSECGWRTPQKKDGGLAKKNIDSFSPKGQHDHRRSNLSVCLRCLSCSSFSC